MKKVLSLLLAASMCLAVTGCGSSTSSAAASTPASEAASTATDAAPADASGDPAVTIILGHYGAAGEPTSTAADKFAEEVAELSGGSITVEVHGASELGNATEMAEQTSLGAIQACLITEGTLDKYDKRYALVMTPFTYNGYNQAYAVVDGPFAEWVADGTLEASGLHDLGSWDYGFRCLTNSVRDVAHPDDVKGLKIRTPSEIQESSCMEALGADVQQIAFTELVTALKQGAVDGQENPLSTIYNNSLWEANQTHLSLTRHVWQSVHMIVNNDFFESLTDAQKAALEQASASCSASMREDVRSSENDYIEKLAAEGVTVTEVDTAEFKACMEPAYDQLKEYVGNAEWVDKFNEMAAEYSDVTDD